MTTITKKLLATLIAAMFAAMSVSASADESVLRSEKVEYSALDLSTNEGTEKVYARIRKAARRVCHVVTQSTDPSLANYVSPRCFTSAVAQAIDTIGNRELTALHQGHARFAAR